MFRSRTKISNRETVIVVVGTADSKTDQMVDLLDEGFPPMVEAKCKKVKVEK